jgi:hypothetical protein
MYSTSCKYLFAVACCREERIFLYKFDIMKHFQQHKRAEMPLRKKLPRIFLSISGEAALEAAKMAHMRSEWSIMLYKATRGFQ